MAFYDKYVDSSIFVININEELGLNLTRSADRPIDLSLHVLFGIATTCYV